MYGLYILPIFTLCIVMVLTEIHCTDEIYACPKSTLTIHPCECMKATGQGLSIMCNNTNLASLSIALANIAVHNTPIEDLLVDYSNFGIFFGRIFLNLKAYRVSIQNTPIESVDAYAFFGINETLTEFEFMNTMLEEFPKSFNVLGKLVSLILDKHKINKLDSVVTSGGYLGQRLERLYITNGKVTEISVEFLQSFRKLKVLDLHGNNLEQLKRNQFKNLRDLESLDISFNRIQNLDASHIADLTKLGWCNLSHNAISEIARGTFARNSVLRVLNISNNRIKRLDANSFRGMRFLRRLYLSDNMISDVGRGTFTTITRIGTIDLARNQLKKIDYQMFAQLNYVEHIDISENQILEVQKHSFKDLYLTHINISYNNIHKFEQFSFENCVNMTTLDLSHNWIKTFPKKVFDENSYASAFLLSYNQLTNISTIPFRNMTGLRLLNVSYNELVEIPKNTFPKLYELHTIDLSHNKITYISNGVFQTLFSLRYLNLSSNNLNEINGTTFGTISTLLEINFNNNTLRKVAKGALVKLNSLRTLTIENNRLTRLFDIPISLNVLSLRNNSINEIVPKLWPSMNALIQLDLSNNLIENHLSQDSFTGLMSLRYLNLSGNGVSIISQGSFSALPTLQHLYLENNKITVIPTKAFGNLPVVFELILRNNNISIISSKAFDGLTQLLKLDLSKNNISSVPPDGLFGLVSLQKLDLSYNNLQKLDNKTNSILEYCLSLEEVNLSNNRFNFISKKLFPSDPYIPYRLQKIDLSSNEIPVLDKDLTFGTHKVKYLNISHNLINEIRDNVFSNLTELEQLDISYNQLSTFMSDFSTFPENLNRLIASNNQIQTFSATTFRNISTIKLIDLRNNTLESFDLELLNKVGIGLQLYITGNPVKCDCNIRPLKHFYQTILDTPKSYNDIICHSPSSLANRPLYSVADDNLNCIDSEKETISVKPDLVVREMLYSKGNLSVRWTVLPQNKDIAGFYIIIRNHNNRIILEHHVSYEYRNDHIKGNEICKNECNNLEICILSKNSYGSINGWFDSQCKYLPNDLESIKEKYNNYNEQIYVIHSLRKARKVLHSNESSAIRPAYEIILFIPFISVLRPINL